MYFVLSVVDTLFFLGRPMTLQLEICTDSVAGVLAAESGGADRAELCSNLGEGGTTPSLGLLRQARRATSLPIAVLVRPRSGDFVYDEAERAILRDDVRAAKMEGADIIVTGALTPDGTIDRAATARLVEAARPLPVTFHRAFDLTRDPAEALDVLLELGIERVLTSGQAPSALEGAEVLAKLVRQAGDRLIVLAGGGVRAHNVAELVKRTGVREVHGSAFVETDSPMRYRNERVAMGSAVPRGEYRRAVTDLETVRGFRAATDAAERSG